MSQWNESEVVETGGIGISIPPQQGMQVSPADQALRDKARLAILEDEVKANPNDLALGREITAERRKQGAASPPSAWDDSEITTPTAAPEPYQPYQGIDPAADTERFGENPGTGGRVLADFAHGVVSSPARINNMAGNATLGGQAAHAFKRALGIDKVLGNINQQAATTPDSTAGKVGSFVGDVAMTAPAAAAIPARIIPQVVGNAGLSAGISPDAPLEGAAWGAGGGAVGHALGKALGIIRQGAKPTPSNLEFQQWINEAQQHAGVPPTPVLTPGQLAPKDGWLRKMEGVIADIPLVGAPLRERARDAMRGFQQASRDTVKLPTAPDEFAPAKSIQELKDGFKKAYSDALGKHKVIVGGEEITAEAAKEIEKEMGSQASRYMRSNDIATINEGRRIDKSLGEFRDIWRSQLPDKSREALEAVDDAYSRFAPIKKVSEKAPSALLTPEDYTPKDLLRALRNKTNEGSNFQRAKALKAEDIIGSTRPKATVLGGMGLGGMGILSVLTGQHIPAAAAAAGALGYGTKTGQKVARGLQRGLTSDEMAITAEMLRRGATPALAGGKKRDE